MARLSKAKLTEAAVQHKANMAASLLHRLEVARASNNEQLVRILEQERQQLSLDTDLSR